MGGSSTMYVANHGKIAPCLSTFPNRRSESAQLAERSNLSMNSLVRQGVSTGERRRASLVTPRAMLACIPPNHASANLGASLCPEAPRSAARRAARPRLSMNSLCPARRRPPATPSIARTVSAAPRTRRCSGIGTIQLAPSRTKGSILSRSFTGLLSPNMKIWSVARGSLAQFARSRKVIRSGCASTMIMTRESSGDSYAIAATGRSDFSATIPTSCSEPSCISRERARVIKKESS